MNNGNYSSTYKSERRRADAQKRYRRRRDRSFCAGKKNLVILCMAVILLASILIALHTDRVAGAAPGSEEALYKYYTTVTVEKGETLWDIAVENYSDRYYDSISDYIAEVKEMNGLDSDTIHEGAKLVIVYFSTEYK